ncbi:MAG: nucleotidyl transferase AbiEii/AbiGii toxin family protein [Pseudomonadota bacterium]
MDLHPDFKDLLVEFDRFGVRYALLGGYAVGYHSKPRATKDLDLLISGLHGNLERVAAALVAFGAPAHVIEIVRTLSPNEIAHFGVPPVRVDLLRSADGIDAEGAIARAQPARLDDLSIPVLTIDDLIANKRAAKRPQDLADVALLERVRSKSEQ